MRLEDLMATIFVELHVHIDLFFFNDTATTEIYTLSLHDALPISQTRYAPQRLCALLCASASNHLRHRLPSRITRSEEHTSELQSPCNLVCRLLLEKKKTDKKNNGMQTSTHRENRLRECSAAWSLM